MTKNKVPMRENIKNYRADIEVITYSLLAISDREYQLRVWHRTEGPEVDWFEECLLSFNTEMDAFRDQLRRGETSLDPSQVKAILRVHVMTDQFCKILSHESENTQRSWAEEQLYIINHPYWQKIQKQATHALSLLKKNGADNKPLRIYGSIEKRTATRHPRLDGRFRDKLKVFADPQIRMQNWKGLDDFWESVHGFDDVYNRFWGGGGMISNGWLYEAMIAFDTVLEELCKPYEGNETVTLDQVLSDPRFHEVEQKAQDYLKLIEP